MKDEAKRWLKEDVFPLWLARGVDWKNGGFFECLSLDGEPMPDPRRAMVQARQIYSCRTGIDLGVCDAGQAAHAIEGAIQELMARYSLPNGAFAHAVDEHGAVQNSTPDLYTQAFALFGMANAYALLRDPKIKARALGLYRYLHSDRRAPAGGFTEQKGGPVLFQSNPHMHLFEAAICWMELDDDNTWKSLAQEVLSLCLEKFIDKGTGALCEHFTSAWEPQLEGNRFLFEPGHHCEWAWLIKKYECLSGEDFGDVAANLFALSEVHGRCPQRKALIDEVWSDFTPKSESARFWPQCERIKAAVRLDAVASADEGMKGLWHYFATPTKGLWFDTWQHSGLFKHQPAKASSLYHIISAIAEYEGQGQ